MSVFASRLAYEVAGLRPGVQTTLANDEIKRIAALGVARAVEVFAAEVANQDANAFDWNGQAGYSLEDDYRLTFGSSTVLTGQLAGVLHLGKTHRNSYLTNNPFALLVTRGGEEIIVTREYLDEHCGEAAVAHFDAITNTATQATSFAEPGTMQLPIGVVAVRLNATSDQCARVSITP